MKLCSLAGSLFFSVFLARIDDRRAAAGAASRSAGRLAHPTWGMSSRRLKPRRILDATNTQSTPAPHHARTRGVNATAGVKSHETPAAVVTSARHGAARNVSTASTAAAAAAPGPSTAAEAAGHDQTSLLLRLESAVGLPVRLLGRGGQPCPAQQQSRELQVRWLTSASASPAGAAPAPAAVAVAWLFLRQPDELAARGAAEPWRARQGLAGRLRALTALDSLPVRQLQGLALGARGTDRPWCALTLAVRGGGGGVAAGAGERRPSEYAVEVGSGREARALLLALSRLRLHVSRRNGGGGGGGGEVAPALPRVGALLWHSARMRLRRRAAVRHQPISIRSFTWDWWFLWTRRQSLQLWPHFEEVPHDALGRVIRPVDCRPPPRWRSW
jgi:hypothetical protein